MASAIDSMPPAGSGNIAAMNQDHPSTPSTEDNTVAIVAYLTLIGFIAAIIIHGSKKTSLGAYHLRQALGLLLFAVVGSFAIGIVSIVLAFIPYLGALMIWVLWAGFSVGMLALVVLGIIAAVNRKAEPLPVVGELFQKWFATAFN
jgi:uncharacterized membrane protein